MKRQTARHGASGDPAALNDGINDAMNGAIGAGPAGYASMDDAADGAELLEDRAIRMGGGRHGRRFGMSFPGAIAGTFLVAALAFGAAIGPLNLTGAGSNGADANSGDTAATEPTDKPDGGTAVSDHPDGADKPDGGVGDSTGADEGTGGSYDGTGKDESPDATDKPEPTDVPAPDAAGLDIGLALDGNAVVVEWSRCDTDGFLAYKVIRSRDEFATWPLGAGDALAGVFEDPATQRMVDRDVDGGRTYHYRVVALRSWEGGKAVACSSDTAAIDTPAPPKPDPTGDPGQIGITVGIAEGQPVIGWTTCAGLEFSKYKVVRSTDATVTWPLGENDALIAVVGLDGDLKAWDADAPAGTKLFYRVFCVRATEAGYVVVAASPVKGIETPPAPPAPDPVALGFEAGVTADGVGLYWEPCTGDGFAYYKVVRSLTTENPSYFPWTDGTELIGVIENATVHQFTDTAAISGQTIHYRVQCIGYWYGTKVLLGQTAVVTVTIP